MAKKSAAFTVLLCKIKVIYDLKKSLGFSIPFYSLIVFDGDCVLKKIDSIPRGVFITGFSNMSNVINLIINNNKTVNYINKDLIIRILKRYEENGKNSEYALAYLS